MPDKARYTYCTYCLNGLVMQAICTHIAGCYRTAMQVRVKHLNHNIWFMLCLVPACCGSHWMTTLCIRHPGPYMTCDGHQLGQSHPLQLADFCIQTCPGQGLSHQQDLGRIGEKKLINTILVAESLCSREKFFSGIALEMRWALRLVTK